LVHGEVLSGRYGWEIDREKSERVELLWESYGIVFSTPTKTSSKPPSRMILRIN